MPILAASSATPNGLVPIGITAVRNPGRSRKVEAVPAGVLHPAVPTG